MYPKFVAETTDKKTSKKSSNLSKLSVMLKKNLTRTTNHHKDNLLQAGTHTLGFSQHFLSAVDVHRTGIFFRTP